MKLNNKFLYAAAVLSLVGASSCSDYLDKEVDLTMQAELVFSDYDMTRGFQAKAYEYLPDAFSGFSNTQFEASMDDMTDNAVSYWGVHHYHGIVANSFDATNHPFASGKWNNRTAGIRHCNQYLKNAKSSVVGNAEKSGDNNKLYDRWNAEVAMIRAILTFDLCTWFGDVPIIGDDENGTPIILEPGMALPPRTPADEVLQWVADQCDKYKDALPFRYSNEAENWGRVNGAAAYALKARALLYKASPLYNPNNDQSRWQAAAQAALDFINKNKTCKDPYRLHKTADDDKNQNYYQCFVSDPVYNNEYILSRSVWTTNALIMTCTPPSFNGAAGAAVGYVNPTQNLVDSYETIKGLPIDQDPSYDPQNPYVNRDPRLDQTIFHHGTEWGIDEERRHINVDQANGVDLHNGNGGTATGYFSKKYVTEVKFDRGVSARVACPIFRYAEVLLNAAEALNEAGQTSEAYQYVNEVRERVGMPAYKGMTKDQLRERIQNERRIELCFEDHRWFDTRRWKLYDQQTAQSEQSLPKYRQIYHMHGVHITGWDGTEGLSWDQANAGITYDYRASDVDANHTFVSPRNYFYPIPYTELMKTGYTQTPGW